jgi:hypothetical protein
MTCSDRNLPRSSVHSLLVVDEVATPTDPRKNGLLSCCGHAHSREQITSPPTYTARTYGLANGVTDSDVEIYGLGTRTSQPHCVQPAQVVDGARSSLQLQGTNRGGIYVRTLFGLGERNYATRLSRQVLVHVDISFDKLICNCLSLSKKILITSIINGDNPGFFLPCAAAASPPPGAFNLCACMHACL